MSAPPAIAAEELKTWQVLYPVYINVQKKVSEGRRVPRNKCCERPSIQEMAEVCRFLKLQVVLEPDKAYSRDFLEVGRIRVLLKADGKPVNPEVPHKRALMMKMGELIPQLQSRASKSAASTQAAGGGSTKKKKGKR